MPYEIKFGKHKGKTVDEIAQLPDGPSYLNWVVSQPATDPKYADTNAKRNSYINKVLANLGSAPAPQQVGSIELSSPKEYSTLLVCMADDITKMKKDIAELKVALVPKDQEEW